MPMLERSSAMVAALLSIERVTFSVNQQPTLAQALLLIKEKPSAFVP
jgi:hypothetical protein